MFCTPPSRSRPACKSTCRPFLPWLKSQSPQLRLSALKRAPSAMLRWLLPVFVSSAQGALLRNVAIGVLDSNGTAASPGEVPASLSVGFTTVSDNTNLATVTLPSGLASSGTLSFGARRLEEADESDFDVGRRLAATCEAYGTASISGTTLTFSVRQINTGSTPCAAGSSLSVTLTAGTASYSSPEAKN
ncbi:unnamed protein product, partial [Effrenium voratum]